MIFLTLDIDVTQSDAIPPVLADSTVNPFGNYLLQVCKEFVLFTGKGVCDQHFLCDYTYVSATVVVLFTSFYPHKTKIVRPRIKHMPLEIFVLEQEGVDKLIIFFKERIPSDQLKLRKKKCFSDSFQFRPEDINLTLFKIMEGLQAGTCMDKC